MPGVNTSCARTSPPPAPSGEQFNMHECRHALGQGVIETLYPTSTTTCQGALIQHTIEFDCMCIRAHLPCSFQLREILPYFSPALPSITCCLSNRLRWMVSQVVQTGCLRPDHAPMASASPACMLYLARSRTAQDLVTNDRTSFVSTLYAWKNTRPQWQDHCNIHFLAYAGL